MSSFTDRVQFEATDKFVQGRRVMMLTRPLVYYIGDKDSSAVVTVPEGFRTDLASVPRFARPLFQPDGRHAAAAVVHDWLYCEAKISRRVSDLVFYEACLVLSVTRWRADTMYRAVRVGGANGYGRKNY